MFQQRYLSCPQQHEATVLSDCASVHVGILGSSKQVLGGSDVHTHTADSNNYWQLVYPVLDLNFFFKIQEYNFNVIAQV